MQDCNHVSAKGIFIIAYRYRCKNCFHTITFRKFKYFNSRLHAPPSSLFLQAYFVHISKSILISQVNGYHLTLIVENHLDE